MSRRQFGSGEPVVIMHGLLGSGRNWQAVGKALAREFDVYLVDLRNHGDSPWADEMSYPAMAADILRMLDDLGLERASLVGHSMGGKAAMCTALAAPERIARLAVVDIAPVAYDHGHGFRFYLETMLSLDLASMSRRADIESGLAESIEDAPIRAFLAQNSAPGDSGLFWKSNLRVLLESLPTITGWPEPPENSSFAGPTLFLRGGQSPYVEDSATQGIRELFPALELETVDGAGHWVHAEAPKATLEALHRLLAES
ncbi:MAG: alpha/beta fold hydrolase [Geminicoccaceae bacterium]